MATVLKAAGDTFVGYAEQSIDQNHTPWEYFPEGTSVEQDISNFPASNFASLPSVSFVIPNVNDDMHNGTIRQGDTWLQNNINAYAQWAKANNSLLAVVWDEDDGTQNNQVPAILYGANINPGTYNTQYNHFSMLRTILAAEGLTALNNAATAALIGNGVFNTAQPPPPTLSGQVVLSSATEHVALPGTTTIATFSDTNTRDTAASFTATINWGDGTSSAASVSGSNGSFAVSGGHTYADEANDAVTATITQTATNTRIAPTGNVAVGNNDSFTAKAATIAATAGQSFSGSVAHRRHVGRRRGKCGRCCRKPPCGRTDALYAVLRS